MFPFCKTISPSQSSHGLCAPSVCLHTHPFQPDLVTYKSVAQLIEGKQIRSVETFLNRFSWGLYLRWDNNYAMMYVNTFWLNDNKILSGFSQTQQCILIYFYLDDMFRSIDHHQAIFTKPRIRCMQCKWHSCNKGYMRLINVVKYLSNTATNAYL